MWQEKVFTYGIIFLLFFSAIASGSVDLWAQTVVHLGTIFLLLLYFFFSFQRKEILLVSPPGGLFVLLFSLVFSYSFSYSKFTSREEFFNWLNYFVFFLFAPLFSEEKELFSKGIIGIAIFLVLKGIFDYLFQGIYPLKSSLINPNILAGYLILVIPLTVKESLKFKVPFGPSSGRGQSLKLRIGYQLSGILLLMGLILTGSLGAILSLSLAFVLYFRKKIGPFIFLTLTLILISILILKLSQAETGNRLLWWQGAGKMFLTCPLTGIGLGNFARYYPQFKAQGLNSLYAHNHYLQILAEDGIFALLGFFGVLIYFFRQKEKNLGICLGITALLIHNFIDYNLAIPAVSLTFWTLLGLEINKERSKHLKQIIYSKVKTYFLAIPIILLLFFSYLMIKFFLANRAYARGLYFFHTEKNLPKAEKELLISLKLAPEYTPTYHVLSAVYTQYYFRDKSRDWLKQALVSIEKVIEKEKKYALYWLDKAWIHYLLGEKEIARRTFEEAKKLKIPTYLTTNLEKLLRGNYLSR